MLRFVYCTSNIRRFLGLLVVAVIRGKSTLRVGCGPEGHDDLEAYGKLIPLVAGDVIILPAGVAHCSIDSDPEYLYIGAYPLVSLM